MSSETKQSKGFAAWYASTAGKRVVGAVYSIGAAVVIVGALFKIMHWPGAGILLTAGMITEAILFTIGVFDKPHKEYDWGKVFDFEAGAVSLSGMGGVAAPAAGRQPVMSPAEKLDDKEMVSLSEGIRQLSETARQLNELSVAAGSAKTFAQHLESASEVAGRYAETQQSLNKAADMLSTAYKTLNADMNTVLDHTKRQAATLDEANRHLAGLNSVYEIQLKNLQSQSEAVAAQAECARRITESLHATADGQGSIQQATRELAGEIGRYKESAALLANQVAELNKVYGNMLNALN